MLSMDQALVGGGLLHVAFTGLLLVKLVWARTCRGVSLGSQELYLVVYTMRNLDLLFLYTGLWTTLRKILEVVAALAIVLLMRYSPAAATYEAEYDSFPRTSLVAPCLVLAFFLNKVKLIIEICHAFSVYLEALALVPQFYMLHKRVAYEPWVLQLTIMIGGERLLQTAAVLMDWTESIKDDPYSVAADITHALVFAGGLALLAAQKVQLKRQQVRLGRGAAWSATGGLTADSL